jgi:hypothetical protein
MGQDKVLLKEDHQPGDAWRIKLAMELTGQLQMKSGEKLIFLELRATAKHRFHERLIGVDKDTLPERVARFYDEAQADVSVHASKETRTLRAERRLQVAQRSKDGTVAYALAGPLTREEYGLTGDHFDLLAVSALLPGKDVLVGESWDVSVPTAQALAGLGGLVSHNLVCKLEQVKDSLACVSVWGNVDGITYGAEMKSTIEGYLWFDVHAKRWTGLRWKQKDERGQGPVLPGAKTETNTTVVRTFGANSDQLSDAVAAAVPTEPSPAHLLLVHRDSRGRHEFLHERDWHVIAQNEQCTVLRLLEKGELIAQLNVTPHTQSRPGEHISAEEFQRRVHDLPDFKVGQVLQAGEVPAEPGYWVYRLSVAGQSKELDVIQNHYVVVGPKGGQVFLTFTTELSLVERLGAKDLSIVGTVSFPEK